MSVLVFTLLPSTAYTKNAVNALDFPAWTSYGTAHKACATYNERPDNKVGCKIAKRYVEEDDLDGGTYLRRSLTGWEDVTAEEHQAFLTEEKFEVQKEPAFIGGLFDMGPPTRVSSAPGQWGQPLRNK